MTVLLTQSTTPIIGQLAWLMGKVLDFIYNIGVHNIGVCIIILTCVVYMLMLPLTIKQQKFSKITSIMQPEIQAVQKKYKGKRDQESMQKMQEEQRAIYDKYGVSASSGCLNLIITFPLLIAFYSVVRNIPAYVGALKNYFTNSGVIDIILKSNNSIQKKIIASAAQKPISIKVNKLTQNNLIDILWKYTDKDFHKLQKLIPSASEKINGLMNNISEHTAFLCYNIAETPLFMLQNAWGNKDYLTIVLALFVPILSGLTQWLNIKLMPQPQQDPESSMGSSLKMMNLFMPLFSVYITFTLPIGLGIYWIAAAVFRSIQQVCINKYLDRTPVENMIKKNQEKMEKKRARKGLPSSSALKEKANIYAKTAGNSEVKEEKPSASVSGQPKPGSLAAKAQMVKNFNESNKTNKK